MAKLNPKTVMGRMRLQKLNAKAWLNTLRTWAGVESEAGLLAQLAVEGEPDLFAKLLEKLELNFEFFPEELKRIPEKGPVIMVCNHPLPGLDALILFQILHERRPDLKIIGSQMRRHLEHLRTNWQFDTEANPWSDLSLASLIEEERAVAIFPASKVSSHFDLSRRQFRDGQWSRELLEEIARANVPVLPVYFKANQNLAYQVYRQVQPAVKALSKPFDFSVLKPKPVTLRFGRSIYPKELAEYAEVPQLEEFLKAKVYILSRPLAPHFKLAIPKRPEVAEPIIAPIDARLIDHEMHALELAGAELSSRRNYKVYLAESSDIPHSLQEIGRLREETFRRIGEGSNLALDLDSFDQTYHHLILWDSDQRKIAGAYRLGIGPELYAAYGSEGFYLNTLFKFSSRATPMLGESLEMGRAFVVSEHQNKPLPLYVLWEGIRALMRERSDLKYILGCASISNNFSKFSKALMVAYLLKNFGDAHLATEIKARKAFRPKLNREGREIVMHSSAEDLFKFDRKIDEIEPGDLRMPPLIKKYLQQNALMVCFNVDPLFNNSLDGFMYIHRHHLEL